MVVFQLQPFCWLFYYYFEHTIQVIGYIRKAFDDFDLYIIVHVAYN